MKISGREYQGKDRALAIAALHIDLSSVRLCQFFHNGEADAESAL